MSVELTAERPRRILVRGVNWLGDAVMTTPAILRLREHFPEASITLLTHGKLSDLWRGHPGLDAVLTFSAGEGPWAVARRLRSDRFDLFLVLPNSPRSALEGWVAGIPKRVGYARPWRSWFLTDPVQPHSGVVRMRKRSVREIRRLTSQSSAGARSEGSGAAPEAHQSREYLHLAAALGSKADPLPPLLAVGQGEVQAAAAKFGLGKVGVAGRTMLGLNAGAEYGPAKRWPVERFIAAARELQHRTGCAWLILGGAGDLPLARTIHEALGAEGGYNLAGQTTLRELMAVLKLCGAMLTNDTGPMHVAAALGVPVVVPFGSTSAGLTGPGLPGDQRHRLLTSHAVCSPCFLRRCPIDFRCMTGIPVEKVIAAMLEVMAIDKR